MPMAVLEAQAMGVPVLAQPASSLPEIIRTAETGWLLPVSPVEGWVELLRELLRWPTAQRAAYAQRSREITVASYSWDVIAPRYRTLYASAIKS
jgi:glycosyltransferase involved in cell wall biosynthesis